MVALDLGRAPPVQWPARFLGVGPYWGVLIGVMLLMLDETAWSSRWQPQLLALIHALLLGVIGNTCLGALIQFLSAAAGSPPRLTATQAMCLLLGYNAGVVLLVAGFWWPQPAVLLPLGAVLLVGALSALTAVLLAGLARGQGERLLRGTLAWPIGLWALTALFGGALAGALRGWWSFDLIRLTDLHALLGLFGVFGLLLVAVGRIVLPMLLGVRRIRAANFRWLFAGLTIALIGLLAWRAHAAIQPLWWRLLALLLLTVCVITLTKLQGRARSRNRPLAAAWLIALSISVLTTARLLWLPMADVIPALTALLGVVLPLLVLSMALEIGAFLSWIDLHRQLGPGVHQPSVHALLPDAPKWRWLIAQSVAGLSVIALSLWPSRALSLLAGLCTALAFLLLLAARRQPARCIQRFLAS